MSDSNPPDHLDDGSARTRERRVKGIKRWVGYIQSEPPETWEPQQNAVADAQMESARSAQTSAAHRRDVATVAAEILAAREEADDESA